MSKVYRNGGIAFFVGCAWSSLFVPVLTMGLQVWRFGSGAYFSGCFWASFTTSALAMRYESGRPM